MREKAIHNGYCLCCGKESISPFCNRQCYLKYVGHVELCVCRHCGKTYKPRRAEFITYCSRNCYFAGLTKRKEARLERETVKRRSKVCVICGALIPKHERGGVVYCGDECRKKKARDYYYLHHVISLERAKKNYQATWQPTAPFACKECGEIHQPEYGDKATVFCSATCRVRDERRRGRHSNGAFKRYRVEQGGERFKVADIYERDRWTCQICHGKVNRRLKYPHPMSASLDHITAIAKGGTHTRANVQLVHLVCNVSVGVGGVKQLRMFG